MIQWTHYIYESDMDEVILLDYSELTHQQVAVNAESIFQLTQSHVKVVPAVFSGLECDDLMKELKELNK